MFKSFLVVALSMILISSVLIPSFQLICDTNIEWLDIKDLPQDETNKSEIDAAEKEIISHTYKKHSLLHLERALLLSTFHQDCILSYTTDIFLPPPERNS